MRASLLLLVGFSVSALFATSTSAAKAPGIPEKALQEMAYRVGKWQADLWIDGVKQARALPETTTWRPGKYCITMHSIIYDEGVTFPATGMTGWNAETQQLVEHWYGADGSYATFRYSLDKKKESWVGTFKWVYSDGKTVAGKSVVDKKSHDEWQWNAAFTLDGKSHTYRAINRRVK